MSIDTIRGELLAPGSTRLNPERLAAAGFLARYSNELTRNGHALVLRQWYAWCDQVGVSPLEVLGTHVELWLRQLEEQGRRPATVAGKVSVLGAFYRHCEFEELLAGKNPMLRVERPRIPDESRVARLSEIEVGRLLTASRRLGVMQHALVTLLANNGLRVSEACGIDLEHFWMEGGYDLLRVVGKGNKARTLPIAPPTRYAVHLAAGDRTGGPLLLRRDGRRLDRRTAWRWVNRSAQVAGISKRVHPHTFRHAYVTTSLDAGASVRDVADSVGHADTRTTTGYDRNRGAIQRNTTFIVAGRYSAATPDMAVA